MLAASFIALTIGNIGLMVGGLTLCFVCLVAGYFARQDGGSDYTIVFVGFAAFFLIGMGIIGPHMSTVNGRHHAQVFADLPREYGNHIKVVDNSVRDHWVEFQLPSCGKATYRYNNMRLIGGHYWFAIGVVKKDEQDQKYTDYQAIATDKLRNICATATVVS